MVFNMLLTRNNSDFFTSVANCLEDSFANFSISDLIDILFLAAILFLAFRFIKGRTGGVLLIGIAILLVVTGLAAFFNLNATFFIFSKLFEVGMIAIIVIFQPEIRDALEKVGSGSINGLMNFGDQKKKRQLYYSAIDHICTAVADLSSRRTGALIVISRTTKLDDIIQTGITIDAEVNSFLLRNIFFTNAPLHDGAVIIDEARVAAAGCLLPLTHRTDIDSDLGTRHRAAIGMCESSDAIVIVVSEETGIISVAYDSTLTREYTTDSLRKFLTQKMIRIDHDSNESSES